MRDGESLIQALQRMESMDNWQHYVEDAWIRMSNNGRDYINSDGTMPKDWLLSPLKSDSFESFFGWWGWMLYPQENYHLLCESIDLSKIKEASHPGLSRWKDASWIGSRGHDLSGYLDQISPITAATVHNIVSLFDHVNSFGSVVHWGPGSGNYTLMMRHLGATHTEFLIDLPLVSLMQYDFLRRSFEDFGYGDVNLITSKDDQLIEGGVNIVPLPFVDNVPQDHDLFIAFHSLSESSVAAQNYVISDRSWFGADMLALSWNDNLQEILNGKLEPWGSGSAHWTSMHTGWDSGLIKTGAGTHLYETEKIK